VVPSLPVVLVFKIRNYVENRRTQRRLQPLALIPDSFEVLSDGDGLRIAASLAKPTWNTSITIGLDGTWYELEREERGTPPRVHVYVLRRAPITKILRAYEEYDLGAAIKLP
jgi:hypothetical protein